MGCWGSRRRLGEQRGGKFEKFSRCHEGVRKFNKGWAVRACFLSSHLGLEEKAKVGRIDFHGVGICLLTES